MDNVVKNFIFNVAMLFGLIGIILSHILSKRRVLLSAIFLLLSGILIGIYSNSILIGLIISIFLLIIIIPSGWLTQYYARKGRERLSSGKDKR